MDKQQRTTHYFDLIWRKIISNYRMERDLNNFIERERDELSIEMIARLGHYAYGDRQDNNDLFLASIMQKRIAELQSEKTEKLEVRKANYFSILIKAISKDLNQDMVETGMVFLFEDSHTSINVYEFELLASFAYKEHKESFYQLFAILLKERFFELIKKSLVPQASPAETFPRYRDELKDCKIEDFTIDSAERNVLSASVSKLSLDGAFSKVTAQKLVAQGITTGMALFKTSSLWLKSYLDAKELQQVHELFIFSGLHAKEVAQRIETLKKMNDFLKTPIADLDLAVRLTGAITAYNGGRPIEDQFLTAGDIYKTSVHEFLKLRNVGKKQIRDITELFAKHNLFWS